MKPTVGDLRLPHQQFLDLLISLKKHQQHSNKKHVYQDSPGDHPQTDFSRCIPSNPPNQPVEDPHYLQNYPLTQRHIQDATHWVTDTKTIMINEESTWK